MPGTIEITGIAEVQRALEEKAQIAIHILGIALQQEGNAILAVSKTLVPVDTSRLQQSGRVEDPIIDGQRTYVDITYGVDGPMGPAPYAAAQEFNTSYRHPRGGQAFFLGQPFWASEQGFTQNLADAVRAAL